MKYLPHFFLAALVGLSFSSCAAPAGGGGGGGGAQAELGPHSGQKFALVQRRGGSRDTDPLGGHTIAIVIKIEQQMVNGEQEVKYSASAHKDGPAGPPVNVDSLVLHVMQPTDSSSEPKNTAEMKITKTFPAQGGKFRTVAGEAIAKSSEFPDTAVSLTIPGDQ